LEHSICSITAKIFKHEFNNEQLQALKEAFVAHVSKDWVGCRSALEVFFRYENPTHLRRLDLSKVYYPHILDWYEMLFETDLYNEPDGTPVRVFSDLIWDEFISRMPNEGRLKMREGLKMFYSEFVEPLESMGPEIGVAKLR